MRDTAIIFRKRILPWSETFIATQSGALTRYTPVFAGYSRDPRGAAYVAEWPVLLLENHSAAFSLDKLLLKAFGRAPRRWLRAISDTNPRVVHAHLGPSALPASVLAKALGVPLVVTYHGMDITVVPRSRGEQTRRAQAFAGADRVIAVSDFIADALRNAGCPADKITRHYIGVDTERFTPGSGPRTTEHVLFVGRLVEKKGVIHIVRAFSRVLRAVPGAQLLIAGDGPLRESLEQEARVLGVPAQFLGVQTPAQVLDLMRRAAVLVGPSAVGTSGDSEGLPMVVIEAQACGTPVIASTSGGTAEGIVHGETGFVFAPGDEGALADHLETVLLHPDLRSRMGQAARRHIEERFSLARQTVQLEGIYDAVRANYGDQ